MDSKIYALSTSATPLVAAAIHDGHKIRDQITPLLALSETERLREEDPHTGQWASVAGNQIIGLRSRFEVDLNRPRDKAVYQQPEDAWGLCVWNESLTPEIISSSLKEYDDFYAGVKTFFNELIATHGKIVVYDLHTYNHRRNGPNMDPEDSNENPEVNIGTGTMDRVLWSPIVERFITDLRAYDYNGRSLDVRENVKFQGGQFSRWVHQEFPRTVCSIAIEFKKFFMDEWTGEPDEFQVKAIKEALQRTTVGVIDELEKLGNSSA